MRENHLNTGANDMATTTSKPRRNQDPEGGGEITISKHTLSKARTGQATTMQAIVQDRYGAAPEDVLRLAEIDRPTIGGDEVLVRVHAASVDRGTWHVMAGLPYPIRLAGFGLRRPKYANPGRSLAGTIVEVGAAATGFAVGDEVFGMSTSTFAEYAI